MKLTELTYEHLIAFSNALDLHILDSDTFFDANFLTLIEKYLGYNNCAIVTYEANRTYKDSTGHNIKMGDFYENGFLGNDIVARYISEHYDAIISNEIRVIRVSDLFEDYRSSDYFHYINDTFQLSYSAVIPFDKLRLTLLKTTARGDFTDHEIVLLNTLEKIISSKYNLFSKIIRPSYAHTLEELKNIYFDSISVGVIIFDQHFSILDCNNIGRTYMKLLAPALSISDYFSGLIPLLNFTTENDAHMVERIIKLNEYAINIKMYAAENSSADSEYIFFATIQYNNLDPIHSDSLHISNSSQNFSQKYHLSSREMEIVMALSRGKKYQEIANDLFISINTVRTHVKNIYRKLEIDNQRNLLYLYNQHLQDT